jgi:hypothetical protein
MQLIASSHAEEEKVEFENKVRSNFENQREAEAM